MIFAAKEKENLDKDQNNNENNHENKNILATVGMFFLELVKVAFLAGITVGLVRYFIFKPFYVEGQSMEPTYLGSEYLIIDEISYRFREPERGDIVVFRYPRNPQEFFIKRVVGLPGEKVQIKDGAVYLYNGENPDGFRLSENYLSPELKTYALNEEMTILGDKQYYVLGDNRNASKDSRSFGAVDKKLITGRVLLRGWPLNKVNIFSAPEYSY